MTFRAKVVLFGSTMNIFLSGSTSRTTGEHNQQFVGGVLAARCKMFLQDSQAKHQIHTLSM